MTRPVEQFDILVIGAGPGGIAAASAAAGSGRRVGIVDDNPSEGGQIWRGMAASPHDGVARRWMNRLGSVRRLCGRAIIAAPRAGVLLANSADGVVELHYERLILATGARERFLPFPGWTLPRVVGAGGLQALVKSGLPLAGKRVLVAGSGPLLLPVAAAMVKRHAQVPLIAEQTSWERLAAFGGAILLEPDKLWQAMKYKWRLRNVPLHANCWPVLAVETKGGLRVTLATPDGAKEIDCDYLACGFFLVPNLELPALLGCAISAGVVVVDEFQRAVSGVYAAGELTGIGGLEKSLIEGEIAGYHAAGNIAAAQRLFSARAKARRFAAQLYEAFELREELRALPRDETIVCRCEDVPHGRLRRLANQREAKLQTRCGMGPCQGRICGSACEFLYGWESGSVRPPIFPSAVQDLG